MRDAPNTAQSEYHVPVLLAQSLDLLITDVAGIYVDGTLGGGGHSEGILERLDRGGRVVGIDRDMEAIRFTEEQIARKDKRIRLVHDRFGRIDAILDNLSISQIDGFLLDLGISSRQIDDAGRGFSYLKEGPLDMRMDREVPQTAADLVNSLSEKELADLFFLFGEEKNARKIARRIVSEREKIPFATTSALAEVVRSCVPERWQIKSLSRIFQAIRIAVNGEMDELSEGLTKVYPYLKSDAHVVVIMYHGLESRIVKRYFRGEALSFRRSNQAFGERQYRFRNLTSKGIQASEEEIRQNPRARSAVLRAGEKLAE